MCTCKIEVKEGVGGAIDLVVHVKSQNPVWLMYILLTSPFVKG